MLYTKEDSYMAVEYLGQVHHGQLKLIHIPSGTVFTTWAAALAHEAWLATWESIWEWEVPS